MNIYILTTQFDNEIFGPPIGVYSSHELAFRAIQNNYVENFSSMPLGDIRASQFGNMEVLTCINEQDETVIRYAIILKTLDDVDVESTLVS
jgi:hypothetical protein